MDAGGRVPKVGALGDAGAVTGRARVRGKLSEYHHSSFNEKNAWKEA
jgi:hypothetical protein